MKKIFKLIILSIMFISFNLTFAFAGVSDSGGTSGGGGGEGWDGKWGIGPDVSANGLQWFTFSGDKTLKTDITFYQRSRKITGTRKGAYLGIHSKLLNRWTWLDWRYWDFYIQGSPSEYDSWYRGNGVYQSTGHGRLPDAELVTEASNNGYSYNNGKYYTNGRKKLDAVWVVGRRESRTESKTTIVYAESGGTVILADRSNESAQSLYNNPTTSVNYSGQSGQTEMNHSNTIKATYMTITKTTTYMSDGTSTWDETSTYTKGGKTYATKSISYDVIQPDVKQVYFKPFDLNKNGVADDADVKNSYPAFNGTVPLNMSVDNLQGINDGSALKTLDTNTSLKFNVTFDNDQFGIPYANEGGFNLGDGAPGESYKNSDGTYRSDVISAVGYNGTAVTGKIKASGMSEQNVYGNVSNDVYWSGSMKASVSSNSASLTFSQTEKIGGNNFSFNKGWRGGNFAFKTIKMGRYSLQNGSRPWWEMQYEKGKFYSYGVKYSGTIRVDSISNPTVNDTNLYSKLAGRNMVQPIIKGTIDAKTVGGNLG